LRTAMHEVRRARELDDLTHLDEDLWQIALRAELGSLADAEAALRAAEQALMDAMARGADPIELSALFDAFEQAVANYMQALAREAAEEGRFAEGGGGGGGMNADGLQELLDALREAAELGDTAGSRRALAQLMELLRNMQMTLSQGGERSGRAKRHGAGAAGSAGRAGRDPVRPARNHE
jgi:methylmalonyl-CoA mutase cobalamin-binding subunit